MAASDTDLQVELVAADRIVWSGRATMVIARTAEGDLGVLANHTPVLSLLAEGVVEVHPADGDRVYAAVDQGFLSVANNRVSILSQHAALSDEIDAAQVRAELEAAQAEGDDPGAEERVRRAEVWLRASERAS